MLKLEPLLKVFTPTSDTYPCSLTNWYHRNESSSLSHYLIKRAAPVLQTCNFYVENTLFPKHRSPMVSYLMNFIEISTKRLISIQYSTSRILISWEITNGVWSLCLSSNAGKLSRRLVMTRGYFSWRLRRLVKENDGRIFHIILENSSIRILK